MKSAPYCTIDPKRTAFIQLFSYQWPLKALYNYSPIHAHIHTPMAESTIEGTSKLLREQLRLDALLRDAS
jgi:hypothetical protein